MLIPDDIRHFESNGEKLLFFRFKNDSSSDYLYVLHSVFTSFHIKNATGELDFLVLAPNKGVFAIEVKHGNVRRQEGKWIHTNKAGKSTITSKSPFAQVEGTLHSIRNFILSKFPRESKEKKKFSKILFGTGVAFTSMDEVVDFGQEAHSWQILTRNGLSLPISYYIDALSKGWHNKNKNKFWYDPNNARPTKDDCLKIIQIIRGDFDIDYSEINRLIDTENLIEQFTSEQFHLLEFVRYNERCLIQGAAGTGKTIMAIEIARRKIENNLNTGFFCFNKSLGGRLKDTVSRMNNLNENTFFVGTLHSYLLNKTDISIPEEINQLHQFYHETLPFEFILQNEELEEREKFDFIIIDESQDLLTPYYLEVFDLILKGGIQNGSWLMLGDFSNQAIYNNEPQEAVLLLKSKSNFTDFPPLKINCRNTTQIATQNTLLTGIEKPEFPKGKSTGAPIVTKFPLPSKQFEQIEDILKSLTIKQIPSDKITLLAPRKEDLEDCLLSPFIKTSVGQGLRISTIQSFKGLESSIIILFGFKDLRNEYTQRLLYIGISRAKQKLFLVFEKNLEQEYQKLIQENFIKI